MSVYLVPEIRCDNCDRRAQPAEHVIDFNHMETWAADTRRHYEFEEWAFGCDMDLCPDCLALRPWLDGEGDGE